MIIECVQGDIADQADLDAVVNAANAALMPGGGVAGALHRAAGPKLADSCRPLGPIEPGEAVITPGFDLPNPHIIHVLGPRYGIDEPAAGLLAAGYRNAMRLARENNLNSVGFPALSAGAFGYPLEEAARIAVETVRGCGREGNKPDLVRFVLFGERALEVFRELID